MRRYSEEFKRSHGQKMMPPNQFRFRGWLKKQVCRMLPCTNGVSSTEKGIAVPADDTNQTTGNRKISLLL